jgi:hypothetical protein
MGELLLLLVLCAKPVLGQHAPEGIWEGYDGEWKHVTSQLIALAEATPEDKFAWRPAKGVRSTSEVYAHCSGELLSLKRHRAEDARRFERGCGKDRHLESGSNQVAEALIGSCAGRARFSEASRSAAQSAYPRP